MTSKTSILLQQRLLLLAIIALLSFHSVDSFSSISTQRWAIHHHHHQKISCSDDTRLISFTGHDSSGSIIRRAATSSPIRSQEQLETESLNDSSSSNELKRTLPSQQTANTASIATNTPAQDQTPIPSTWSQAFQHFFLGDNIGPLLATLTIFGFITTRCQLLPIIPFSINELLLFLSSIIIWWCQEYLFHRMILHSPFDWIGKSIHATHHDKDYFHVSIDPPILLLGWLFTAHFLLRALIPQWHLCLSATIGYSLAGLIYEWSHYIVHTKVKPRVIPTSSPSYAQLSFVQRRIIQPIMRGYAKMRDNHIRHHLVDSRYWYAFSVVEMDDLFGTNPNVKDVKLERMRKR